MPDLTTPIFGLTEPTVGGDNSTWGGILNGDIGALDTYIGVLRQAAKVVSVFGTTTIDFNSPASVFSFTVTQPTTVAFVNPPANVTAQQLSTMVTLIITNGGAFTLTWPGSVTWATGVTPKFSASGVDVVVGWTPNNGTNWYLARLGTGGIPTVGMIQPTAAGGSTNQNSEVSIGSVVVPAGKMVTAGDGVRITAIFSPTVGPNSIAIKFGSTYVLPLQVMPISNSPARVVVEIVRVDATHQSALAYIDGTAGVKAFSLPLEILALPVLVDFRGNAQFNGTLTLLAGRVETLTAQ